MDANITPLAAVFDGWQGYQASLVHAIEPLTPDQLIWRPSDNVRSLGQLARHISMARIEWFARMEAPGSRQLTERIGHWEQDEDGNRHILADQVAPADRATELVEWLNASWAMVDATLNAWTVADLPKTYRHRWNGQVYAVSRQWTVWRIMAHDLHHGGQIARILAEQGIEAFELRALGGHIVLPPLASP